MIFFKFNQLFSCYFFYYLLLAGFFGFNQLISCYFFFICFLQYIYTIVYSKFPFCCLDITTKWLIVKETILCKLKEQTSWEMQKKNSRWRICTGRNFKLCKNINEVLSQINCSSEKQYSSCQKIVQGWLSGVQKYHDTLTAYKIKIDELVVEVRHVLIKNFFILLIFFSIR